MAIDVSDRVRNTYRSKRQLPDMVAGAAFKYVVRTTRHGFRAFFPVPRPGGVRLRRLFNRLFYSVVKNGRQSDVTKYRVPPRRVLLISAIYHHRTFYKHAPARVYLYTRERTRTIFYLLFPPQTRVRRSGRH